MGDSIIDKCKKLIYAYKNGLLGQTKMPEDSNPKDFGNEEFRIAYFSLPMALNYQRDSYKLWESALKTWNDKETREVFDVNVVVSMDDNKLREHLMKYKLALQPNKHISTWKNICTTVSSEFGSFSNLIKNADNDYIKLKEIVQVKNKKAFPYLSGPKIFNYWSLILREYGRINLKNYQFIEIAPDTHVTQCSVILGVISKGESEVLSKEEISERWRTTLKDSGINPIDMHPPLWFWSRNGFIYDINN